MNNLLYKAEKPSVHLSAFWNAHNSVLSALIGTGLAENKSCVFGKQYLFLQAYKAHCSLTGVHRR